MAHLQSNPKFAEVLARLSTLYEYATKTNDKAVVHAMKLGANKASEELLGLFDEIPTADGPSPGKSASDFKAPVLASSKSAGNPGNEVGSPSYTSDHATQAHSSNETDPEIVRSICRYCRQDCPRGILCTCLQSRHSSRIVQNLADSAHDAAVTRPQVYKKELFRRNSDQGRLDHGRGMRKENYGEYMQFKSEDDRSRQEAERFLSGMDQHPGGGLKRSRDNYRPGDIYSARGGHFSKKGRYQ